MNPPTIDLTLIVNPWQALVAVVVVFALFVWPSISARQSVRRVEKTLTTTNSGSHVKDQLDRIEKAQRATTKAQQATAKKLDEHLTWSDGFVRDIGERVDRLAAGQTKRRFLFRRRR